MTRLIGVALALVLATPAVAEMRSATVAGWAVNPKAVEVYTQQGALVGTKDLSKAVVAGKHDWNPEYDVVKIGEGEWVDIAALKLTLCTPTATEFAALGTARTKPATGFGSGEPCK